MGFAKYAEDISDRYYEGESYVAIPSYLPLAPREGWKTTTFQSSFYRTVRMIDDLATTFNEHADVPKEYRSRWEDHLRVIDAVHDVLNDFSHLSDDDDTVHWDQLLQVERELAGIFAEYEKYGPLSQSIYEGFARDSRMIFQRIKEITHAIESLQNHIPQETEESVILTKALVQFENFREKLDAEVYKISNSERKLATSRKLWQKYLDTFRIALMEKNHRTPLQKLDRFRLNEDQEREVERDYEGIRRIQGASGCGKTVILIHRALRLAHENPEHTVRVFTINRSLAEHLASIMRTIHGAIPSNIQIAAFYDFMLGSVSLFENKDRYRLVDDCSKERATANSWEDFFRHKSANPENNIFARTDVKKLIRHIERAGGQAIDASRYLREEMIYIQSAFSKNDRELYLEIERSSRSIGLNKTQDRPICLDILENWEEWLETGDLCDIDGLTFQMAKYLDRPDSRDRIVEQFRAEHVFLDEFQDFSTLEMTILKRLFGSDEEKRKNLFFMVGDINQKVFSKHHDRSLVGFNFMGRSTNMRQNYRNTRQILQAAYQVPRAFPPKAEDEVDISDPELSSFNGSQPVVLHCESDRQADTIFKLLQHRREQRVAVVSENEILLKQIGKMASQNGIGCYELFRNDDLDRWEEQQADSLSSDVTLSRLEAVKGLEFDTVIAADLSRGVVPRVGTPQEEKWREAAIVYAALTRARDELIITHTGLPSEFVEMMKEHVIFECENNKPLMEKLLFGTG